MSSIKELFETTELTIQQIADYLGFNTTKPVYTYLNKNYTKDERKKRKHSTYRNSRLGDKNPSFGRLGEDSRKFKGVSDDGNGYLTVLRPEWFIGKTGKRVFQHQLVWCEYHGIPFVPKGYCIHHCDFNRKNNHIDNLICLSLGDHSRLHRWLEGVTTISKESTAKWLEAHGRDWYL